MRGERGRDECREGCPPSFTISVLLVFPQLVQGWLCPVHSPLTNNHLPYSCVSSACVCVSICCVCFHTHPQARLEGHRHYVQGVAWDPLGAWLVSQSADRTVRVHGLKPPPSGSKAAAAAAAKEGFRSSTALARDVLHTHTLSKVAVQPPATPPPPAAATATAESAAPAGEQTAAGAAPAPAQQQQQQPVKPLQAALFHDESLNTFFRRLAWSPEGSLLAVPAGVQRQYNTSAATAAGQPQQQQQQHATYIYARGHWGSPLLSLPCPSKASTAVRFCPRIFKLRQQQGQQRDSPGSNGCDGTQQQQQQEQQEAAAAAGAPNNVLGLPYRLVLAVATMDSVLLYDMQVSQMVLMVVLVLVWWWWA